jgi:hypothetical protein
VNRTGIEEVVIEFLTGAYRHFVSHDFGGDAVEEDTSSVEVLDGHHETDIISVGGRDVIHVFYVQVELAGVRLVYTEVIEL